MEKPSASVLEADATRLPLIEDCVDLVFGSPPYCDARTYGIDAHRPCGEWIEWMLVVTKEALRVCRGPVVWVAGAVTRGRSYWPACEGLMYRWWEKGGQLYRPCIYHRVGIPGSGGSDWFRADTEYVMCFKRPGPLPWSDNTAMGHPPKWPRGGPPSHRTRDGTRINKRFRPGSRQHTKARADGAVEVQHYTPPKLANPGNVVKLSVGGNRIGSALAHENEAPFPEGLAEWFVASLCPPGGVVLDPFSGSGTTAAVALRLGRNAIASDVRSSQVELTKRRLKEQREKDCEGHDDEG